MKTCTNCGREQPVEEFSKHPSGKGGLQPTCKTCNRARCKFYRDKIKEQVFDLLGRRCVCCGESVLTFLTLDHINDDGAAHRREIAGSRKECSGDRVWRWLVKNTDQAHRFQILCYNCNCGKRDNGGTCPHTDAK